MKLHALTETEVTPAVFARYLVVYVDDGGAGDFYIVTDIPPISEEKFQKLFKLSFEPGSLLDWVRVMRIDHTDWYDEMGTEESPFENVTNYVVTWKEFVADVKRAFAPDDDDFSE